MEADLYSLTDDLVDEFEIQAIELNRDDIGYDQRAVKVRPGRNRDPVFGPIDGTEVQFFVPFTGDEALLRLQPSTFTTVLPRAHKVSEGTMEFRFSVPGDQVDAASERLEETLDLLEKYLGWQQDSIEEFNESLHGVISERLEQREAKIEEARSRLEEKGYMCRPPPRTAGRRPGSLPAESPEGRRTVSGTSETLDVFISHASEDKEAVARPVFEALRECGVTVWFDEAELTLGDSLRRKVDEGLARCRFGVVVLGRSFFRKEWPKRELDGLVARETASGEKAILPVWHGVDQQTVAEFSPPLADRLATSTEEGIDIVVVEILRVLGGE